MMVTEGASTGWAVRLVDSNNDRLVDVLEGPYDASLPAPPSDVIRRAYTYQDGKMTRASVPFVGATAPTVGEHYRWTTSNQVDQVAVDVSATRRDVLVEQTFDSIGRVATQTQRTGEVDSFTYTPSANGSDTVVDHVGGSTTETVTFRHDRTGRLSRIEDPDGYEAGRSWDRDLPSGSVTRRGAASTSTFDGDGRLTGAVLPDDEVAGAEAGSVSVSYCGPGDPRPTETTDSAGVVTRLWWAEGSAPASCDAGRTVPVRVTRAHGTSSSWDVELDDIDGLVAETRDLAGPVPVVSRTNWDPNLRLPRSTSTYPAGPTGPAETTYVGYDSAGRVLVERDPSGAETE